MVLAVVRRLMNITILDRKAKYASVPLRRRKHLVREWIRLRPLHAIETEVCRLVAVVASVRERIVGLRECCRVLAANGRTHVGKGLADHARNCILWCDRRVLVRWVELDDVIEAFAELVDLVIRKLPVRGLSRQPQFHVSHLLQTHQLAEAGHVMLLAGTRDVTHRTRGLPTCNRKGDDARNKHGPIQTAHDSSSDRFDLATLRTLLLASSPWTNGCPSTRPSISHAVSRESRRRP